MGLQRMVYVRQTKCFFSYSMLLLNARKTTTNNGKKNKLTGVRLDSSVDSAFGRVKDKGAVDGFYPRVFKELHLCCMCVL